MASDAAIAKQHHSDGAAARGSAALIPEQWYGRVLAYCQSQLVVIADAEDAAQETFLRGFAQLDQLESPEAMGGWLRSIAHHVCVDMIRRKVVRRDAQDKLGALQSERQPTAPDSSMEADDQRSQLIQLIHELPSAQRETILLHYYEQMTYDEMARWLGVARSTVNERLSKARNHLKHRLLAAEGASS